MPLATGGLKIDLSLLVANVRINQLEYMQKIKGRLRIFRKLINKKFPNEVWKKWPR
jgi:hypothetical protein